MFELPPIPQPKSFEIGGNLSYKVREFDPFKHEVQGRTSSHDIFLCPHCLDVRGKEDAQGKLYWDRTKYIGYCFLCLTVVILKSNRPHSEVKLELALKSLLSNLPIQYLEDHKLSNIPFEKLFDPLDQEGINYLINRVPIYADIADKLQFRINPGVGIAVPIIINDVVVSYCLRFYNPENQMKYYISPGTKYLYSPNNVFSNKVKPDKFIEITLVEGIFDAIAALLDGYSNAICLFGKTITPFQLNLIRKLVPGKVNIYLDEAKLSWELLKKIKGNLPTVNSFEVIPTNMDPEERLLARMKYVKSPEAIESLYNDIKKGIDSIK